MHTKKLLSERHRGTSLVLVIFVGFITYFFTMFTILEAFLKVKQLLDAKILIKKLPSFSAPKITVIQSLKVAVNMTDPKVL